MKIKQMLLTTFKAITVVLIMVSLHGIALSQEKKNEKNNTIQVHSWGGAAQEALEEYAFKPFTDKTDIEVVSGNFTSMDQYIASIKASFPPGGEFNIGYMSSFANYIRLTDLGYGAELDESKIQNLKNVIPSALNELRKLDKDGKIFAVPYDYGQTGIVYNPKYVSKEKAERLGVALLWDKSLKGKIAGSYDWRPSIWYAALYTGQDPNNIKDMGAVWDALREQNKLVKKYCTSGSEFNSLFASEDVYVSIAFSGRAYSLKEQGYSIEWLKIPDTFSWMEYMFVLKGTNMDAAYELLNFMLEEKPSIEVSMGQNYPTALNPNKIEMPMYIRNMTSFDKDGKFEGYLFADPKYWATKQFEWSEIWDKIQAGG